MRFIPHRTICTVSQEFGVYDVTSIQVSPLRGTWTEIPDRWAVVIDGVVCEDDVEEVFEGYYMGMDTDTVFAFIMEWMHIPARFVP
jgi:hypothetical protein